MSVESGTVGKFLLCLQEMSSNGWRFRHMSSKPRDPKEQFERFVETARAIGCDEDKERFEKQLGRIASYKPPPKGKKQTIKKQKPAK